MFKCKTLSAFSIKWQPGLLRKTAKGSPVLSFLSLPPSTCTSKQETSRDCRRQPGKEKKGFTVSRALPWPAPQACARHGGGGLGGERWCQSVTPLPSLGRWHWASTWEITDRVEMRKKKGSAGSHWEKQPLEGLGQDQPQGKAPRAGWSAQLSPGGRRDVVRPSPAGFGQRRALAAARSFGSCSLWQRKSLAGTAWESQCWHRL